YIFFFSSRRRHTRFSRDWSSDVCSSDLKDVDQQAVSAWLAQAIGPCTPWQRKGQTFKCHSGAVPVTWLPQAVGKWHSLYLESAEIGRASCREEGRSRWAP